MTIDSIAWGPAAKSRNSGNDANAADSPAQKHTASAWLPVRISGLRIVISSGVRRQGIERKASRLSRAGTKAKAAATTPAVSTALALARRLLPHVPMQLQQVVVEQQV